MFYYNIDSEIRSADDTRGTRHNKILFMERNQNKTVKSSAQHTQARVYDIFKKQSCVYVKFAKRFERLLMHRI